MKNIIKVNLQFFTFDINLKYFQMQTFFLPTMLCVSFVVNEKTKDDKNAFDKIIKK